MPRARLLPAAPALAALALGMEISPDGTVYVSAWGDWTVSVFRFAEDGSAREARTACW